MKIRLTVDFEFHIGYEDNPEGDINGCVSFLYKLPKRWSEWDNDKKQQWLDKNESKINKYVMEYFTMGVTVPSVEDIQEYEDDEVLK